MVTEDPLYLAGKLAGYLEGLRWLLEQVAAEIAVAPPFTDLRPLRSLQSQVEDKIRATQNGS